MQPERYLKVYRHNDKNLPYISLKGRWLEKAGFEPGSIITINAEYGKIIITNDIYNAVKGSPESKPEKSLEERIEKNGENRVKHSSYSDEYHGYKVRLKLEREKNFRPYKIAGSDDAYKFFKPLQYEPREKFLSAYLNAKGCVTGVDEIGQGDNRKVILSPAEVLKGALLSNATSLVLVHNHPSGDPAPSPEDIDLTRRVIDASKLFGIKVLDHIIIGNDSYKSMFLNNPSLKFK